MLSNRQADEILLLRRVPGYLRAHLPPLIYDAKAARVIDAELREVEGIRKVSINKQLGKVTIHYDTLVASERDLIFLIDRVITPLLQTAKQELYENTLRAVTTSETKRVVRKVVVVVILVYLVDLHWSLMGYWLRTPVKSWAKLATVGAMIYMHRNHIKGGLGLNAE